MHAPFDKYILIKKKKKNLNAGQTSYISSSYQDRWNGLNSYNVCADTTHTHTSHRVMDLLFSIHHSWQIIIYRIMIRICARIGSLRFFSCILYVNVLSLKINNLQATYGFHAKEKKNKVNSQPNDKMYTYRWWRCPTRFNVIFNRITTKSDASECDVHAIMFQLVLRVCWQHLIKYSNSSSINKPAVIYIWLARIKR